MSGLGGLLDLPLEILSEIAGHADYEDREALRYTCREFYYLIKPFAELHLSGPRTKNEIHSSRKVEWEICLGVISHTLEAPKFAQRLVSVNVNGTNASGHLIDMLGELPNLKMLKYSSKRPLSIRPGGFKKLEVLYMGTKGVSSVRINGNLQLAFPALKHLCFSSGLITVDRTLTATSSFEESTIIRVGFHLQRYRDKVQWHFDGYDDGVALFCAEGGKLYRRFTAPYPLNGVTKSSEFKPTSIRNPISPAYDGPAFDKLQAAGSRLQFQTIAKGPRVTIVADESHYPRDVHRNFITTPYRREPLRSPAPPYLPTRCPSPPPPPPPPRAPPRIVHVPDDTNPGDSENVPREESYESSVHLYSEDDDHYYYGNHYYGNYHYGNYYGVNYYGDNYYGDNYYDDNYYDDNYYGEDSEDDVSEERSESDVYSEDEKDDTDTRSSENEVNEESYESSIHPRHDIYYTSTEDSEDGVSEESNDRDAYSEDDDDVNDVNDYLDYLDNYYQINSNNWLRPNPFLLI